MISGPQPDRTLGATVYRALAWLRRAATWPVRIRSSRIGFRLFLAFQVVIILTGMIGIRSIQRLNAMSATIDELNRHDLPEVEVLGTALATLYQLRRFARDPGQVSTPNGINLSSTLADLTSERTTLLVLEQSVGSSQSPGRDTPLVDSLVNGIEEARVLSPRVKALIDSGQVGAAQQLASSQLLPLTERDIQLTDELRVSEMGEAAADTALVQQGNSTATDEILILTSLSVIASIVLAVLMTRSVVRPLSELVRATEAITTGNLDVRPRVHRRDELGRLASAFDSMRRALRETISNLKREQRRTQAIIDATADGIVLVDEHRTILQMNPAAERLVGGGSNQALLLRGVRVRRRVRLGGCGGEALSTRESGRGHPGRTARVSGVPARWPDEVACRELRADSQRSGRRSTLRRGVSRRYPIQGRGANEV